MSLAKKSRFRRYSGAVLIIAMIFVVLFATLAVSLATMVDDNVQLADNHHKVNSALVAAQSGLDVGKYLVENYVPTVFASELTPQNKTDTWLAFCAQVRNNHVGNATWTDTGNENELISSSINYAGGAESFHIKFLYDANNATITLLSTGTVTSDGSVSKTVGIRMNIKRENEILKYAIASRGRMWVTGDSTIHGDIYSSWNLSNAQLTQLVQLKAQLQQKLADGTLDSTTFASLVSSLNLDSSERTTVLNELLNGSLSPRDAAVRCIGCMSVSYAYDPENYNYLKVAPFNVTSDSNVLGSISTCWTKDQVITKIMRSGDDNWQFETLDENGNPMYDGDGNKIISSEDEIQGQCEGINYGIPPQNMAGMSISDYNTTTYYDMASNTIPKPSSTQVTWTDSYLESKADVCDFCGEKWRYEYFPHSSTSYTSGSGIKVKRYIYTNQNFTDAILTSTPRSSSGGVYIYSGALFINCTFNGVTYVDCSQTSSSYTNNVRFDNCRFNGAIVSDTPQYFNWQRNCLYFTRAATFDNQSEIQEATILAPHFNVNLGNTNPDTGYDNELRGAIVGGIVDVRGNANVMGTIISMADTSSETSGYVTNIGATLGDGGSETTTIEDVGHIEITPDEENLLPSGITSPVVIEPVQGSYFEG